MYKAIIFDTCYDLAKFLNNHNIEKSDIINILTCSRGTTLIYYEESEE